MALINCPETECGKRVSSMADACPHCGARVAGTDTLTAKNALAIPAAGCRELRVAANGSGDAISIREALQRIDSGGTIRIAPGFYTERLVISRPMTIINDVGELPVVIQAPGETLATIDGVKVRLQGLTMTCENGTCLKISGDAAHVTIDDCRFGPEVCFAIEVADRATLLVSRSVVTGSIECTGGSTTRINDCTGVSGIRCCDDSQAAIQGGEVGNLIMLDRSRGDVNKCRFTTTYSIYLAGQASLVLFDCEICPLGPIAFTVFSDGALRLVRCRIVGQEANTGIELFEGRKSTLQDCRIRGFQTAVHVHSNAQLSIRDCDLRGNKKPLRADDSSGIQQSNNLV